MPRMTKRTQARLGRCRRPDSTSGGIYPSRPYQFSNSIAPNTEDDTGIYNFSVLLGQIASTKNKWAYCGELNKLYIVWHQVIPLEFRWEQCEPNLVVRALPIYTDAQYLHEPVLRCFIHLDQTDFTNEGFYEVKHVIRSDNPGAFYQEDPETLRCSVLVPLGEPQPGTGTVTVTYKFMCKTSCATGMTRRPMAVIFTLERPNGEVLGRQAMAVKVCSCPRRDMEKEVQMLRRGKVKDKLKENNGYIYHFEVYLPDVELFKKILEFNHGAVTSLLRTTPPSDSNYNELCDFLTTVENKLCYLSQWET